MLAQSSDLLRAGLFRVRGGLTSGSPASVTFGVFDGLFLCGVLSCDRVASPRTGERNNGDAGPKTTPFDGSHSRLVFGDLVTLFTGVASNSSSMLRKLKHRVETLR